VDPTPDTLSCESFGLCGTPPRKTNSFGIELVYIPPGSFAMGSPPIERGRSPDETQHAVTLTCGFYMSKFEITKREWLDVMGELPPNFNPQNVGMLTPDDFPILAVGWFSAQEFCRRLTERERVTYTLPTEAQWEYACRAGTQTRFSFGDALACPDDCSVSCPDAAPYMADSCGGGLDILPVGSRLPNPWGLHDMHGNVGEWVLDWYGPYPRTAVFDPKGPSPPPSGGEKVWRSPGAHWIGLHTDRSAARWHLPPSTNETTASWGLNVSFRIVQLTRCRQAPPD
jgi:formylglycine-generating enzyme required for sulfatase activity